MQIDRWRNIRWPIAAVAVLAIIGCLGLTDVGNTQPATASAEVTQVHRYDLRDIVTALDMHDFSNVPGDPVAPKSDRKQTASRVLEMIRKAVPDSPWTSIIDSDDFDKTVGVTITAPASMQAKIANTIEQILVDSQVQISVETRVFELPTKDLKRISFALPIDVNGAQLTPLLVSEKQIQELIGAVQADMAATSVTAPRLTLFNHQSGKIVVSTVQSYVADFTSTKLPNGDVRYDPKVATVPQMATIEEIRAATSESQLTDTLDLHVKFSRLVSLDTTTYRGHEDLHIQVPKEFVSEITGRFAVPDGQNMLFAGGLDKGSDKRALILIKAMVLHPQAGVMKREFPLLP